MILASYQHRLFSLSLSLSLYHSYRFLEKKNCSDKMISRFFPSFLMHNKWKVMGIARGNANIFLHEQKYKQS